MFERLKLWRRRRREVRDISTFCEGPTSSDSDHADDDDIEMLHYESSDDLSGHHSLSEEEVVEEFVEEVVEDHTALDSETENKDENGLNLALKNWAIKNNCTRTCINEILGIFNDLNFSVPMDSRTLLKTERNVNSVPMGLGNFVYVGIERCIQKLLSYKEPSSNLIELMINIDGLPVFKSSSLSLWPILIQFDSFQPIGVAYYCGRSKPPFVSFLYDFVQELLHLLRDGIIFNKCHYTVKVLGFTADAPARASLKGVIQHTGYHSCERCTATGVSVCRRIVFDQEEIESEERNGVSFKENGYMVQDDNGRCHQQSVSGLIDLPIDLVKDFVIDPMHLVFLGVTRRMLYFLKGSFKGINTGKLSSAYLSSISTQLNDLVLPSEFARQPRSLSELDRWKATEFRSFLLYSGPIILRLFLGKESWKHFLSISIAIRLLSNKNVSKADVSVARKLLEYFVFRSKDHFGETFCVYNVHGLLHIPDDVEHFKATLEHISCFQFENHLQKLKKSIRGKYNVLSQIVKRGQELGANYFVKNVASLKVDTTPKNCCFLTQSHLVFIKKMFPDGLMLCDRFKKGTLNSFFNQFNIDSRELDIYSVNTDSNPVSLTISKSQLLKKCVSVPFKESLIALPLCHM